MPQIIEDLNVNAGVDIPLGEVVEFDLRVSSQWKKILYVNIVQINAGAMDVSIGIWEKSNINEGTRLNLIYNKYSRDITLAADGGGTYGETLMGDPLPYKDRDSQGENPAPAVHVRLQNNAGGTASDFAVQLVVADMKEDV